MSTETQRTSGEWLLDLPYLTIHTREKYILRCGWDGEGSKEEAEANAKYICTAVNNHSSLLEALKEACTVEDEAFQMRSESADWHNNNTPGVGDTVPYQTPYPLPQWMTKAKRLLESIKAATTQH